MEGFRRVGIILSAFTPIVWIIHILINVPDEIFKSIFSIEYVLVNIISIGCLWFLYFLIFYVFVPLIRWTIKGFQEK